MTRMKATMRGLRPGVLAPCLAAIALLAGCVTGGQDLQSLASLGPDEMVVAGKIILDPPLGKNEQALHNAEYMRYMVYFHVGGKTLALEEVGPGNLNEMYSSKLGEPFFISVKRAAQLYYSAPFVQLAVMTNSGRMVLPGGLKYSVPQGARAVSIGTITYHRDAYNEIKKVDLAAGDPSIREAFISRFGSQVELAALTPELEK